MRAYVNDAKYHAVLIFYKENILSINIFCIGYTLNGSHVNIAKIEDIYILSI